MNGVKTTVKAMCAMWSSGESWTWNCRLRPITICIAGIASLLLPVSKGVEFGPGVTRFADSSGSKAENKILTPCINLSELTQKILLLLIYFNYITDNNHNNNNNNHYYCMIDKKGDSIMLKMTIRSNRRRVYNLSKACNNLIYF